MSDGIWAAASGAMSQTLALDVAAENIANASTPAYHVDRAVFREMLTRAAAKKSGGFNLVYGSIGSVTTDPTAGAFVPTGRPLDVAIKGESFLVVKTARGERYTRSGNIQMAKDGTLTTRDGDPILDPERRLIKVAPLSTIGITSDGNVLVDGKPSGSLLLVSFADPSRLVKEGATLMRADPAAGKATIVTPQLEVGALESSSSSAVKGMIDIVTATRAFEVCESAIDAFRDADRKAAVELMAPK
ncbi:MAG TPA: flagellar hook basal-body protein [Polyangiaceae bacterium]|nr:flagellar hook basal-body protein [Polyangiaceae bacterium]